MALDNKAKENNDEALQGNEKIEQAIHMLQKEPTQELLAHVLTVIRRRMKENGQLIVSVEPAISSTQLGVEVMQLENGTKWWPVFTSFDEEIRGGGSVKSTFMADMGQLFRAALQAEGIEGLILNPWNWTIMLDKSLLSIILGEPTQGN